MITVIDVWREIGINKPEKHISWSVGRKVRKAFQEERGKIPPKQLNEKTDGSGSHCFAMYPEDFKYRIEEIIKSEMESKMGNPD